MTTTRLELKQQSLAPNLNKHKKVECETSIASNQQYAYTANGQCSCWISFTLAPTVCSR